MALLGLLNALNSYLAYVVIAIIYVLTDRRTDKETDKQVLGYELQKRCSSDAFRNAALACSNDLAFLKAFPARHNTDKVCLVSV